MMGFREFYESKTERDTNQFVTVYHISPEGDIKHFRPKVNRILKDEVVFFSPSFHSLIVDWAPYVKYRRGKTRRGIHDNTDSYKTLYLYTVKIPKSVYKDAMTYMNKKYDEDTTTDGDPGFWYWGSQIALTKDQLETIKISNVRKLTTSEYHKLYKSENFNNRNSSNYKLLDLSSLKKLPKDWLNVFHIKLLETIYDLDKTKQSSEKFQKLNERLMRIRLKCGFSNCVIIPTKDVDKTEFEKIEREFQSIQNPKSSRDKNKERTDRMEKVIDSLRKSDSEAVKKIVLPKFEKLYADGNYEDFKKAIEFYKNWIRK